MSKSNILKKCALFQNLNDQQLTIIDTMYSSEVFEPGAILCKQDKKGEKVYVIEQGLVGILLEAGPLSKFQVQSASKYDVIGWGAMIDPFIYTATVKAIKKTTALVFKREQLQELDTKQPQIGCLISRGLVSIVAKRLHEAYNQLIGITRN